MAFKFFVSKQSNSALSKEELRQKELVARYARGSVSLQRVGGYMTRDDKDKLRRSVTNHKFA